MIKMVLIVSLLISMVAVDAEEKLPAMTTAKGYVEPFKMFDNVYYVGDQWVSSYVIETSIGLVIIDTLEYPYSTWIPINLKKLGLENKAVTHILVTHGHSDHVGGAQYLQSVYNAKVLITEKGYELAHKQSESSRGKKQFLPPKVSDFVQDSSVLVVGDTRFKFYITPGHTEGDLSIDFMANHEGESYRAFVVGGHGTNFQKPDQAKQFIESMHRIQKLALQSPVVTVNLSNHPQKNSLFKNRYASDKHVNVNPFINKDDFFRFVEQQTDLAQEKFSIQVGSSE